MARKVGFDTPDTEPKRSIADSYLDEFRAKATNSRTRAATAAPAPRQKVQRNWFVLIFMIVWITFWSFGILMAIGMLLAGGPVAFMLIWLGAACVGWVVALGVIIKQIKGTPVPHESASR